MPIRRGRGGFVGYGFQAAGPNASTIERMLHRYGESSFIRTKEPFGIETLPGVRPRDAYFDTELLAERLVMWQALPDHAKSEREWLRMFRGSLVDDRLLKPYFGTNM